MKTPLIQYGLSRLACLLLTMVCAVCTPPEPDPAPEADFEYSPKTNLVAPVDVTFRNTSRNADSFVWTFAGQTDTDRDLVLTFKSPGTYPISLEAKGKGGTDTHTETITISAPTSSTAPPSGFTPPGQAVFWATGGWDYVDVITDNATYQKQSGGPYFAADSFGKIQKQTATAPNCGTASFFTTERPGKVYTYTASAYRTGNSQAIAQVAGTYTVMAGQCTSVRIDFPSAPTNTTVSFKNQAFTPIKLTVGSETKTINPNATVAFQGKAGSQVSCKGETSGMTTNGTQVGLKLNWDFQATFPASGDRVQALNVSRDYFFLYIQNSSSTTDFQKLYVNYGLQSQTTDQNLSIPNGGVQVRLGYYRAYSNSNVRLEKAGGYWFQDKLNLSFTENQTYTLSIR